MVTLHGVDLRAHFLEDAFDHVQHEFLAARAQLHDFRNQVL